MGKFFSIICIIVLLGIFSTIGYKVVSANETVKETVDIIYQQNRVEKYFSSYEYTIDNPSIILNPYSISPLTALILFETPKEVSITLTVMGKSNDVSFQNTFQKSKKHFIPVYGLYPDYQNKVIISDGSIKKELTIGTDKLPEDLEIDSNIDISGQLVFVNQANYPYALDKNHDVRWYFNKRYFGKIARLSNGNLLLGNDILINKKYSSDIMEIDLLGKIYYQYHIEDGYYGSFVEDDTILFVLSDDLLKIDRQSGVVLNSVHLDEEYDKMILDLKNNDIRLSGKSGLTVQLDNLDISHNDTILEHNEHFISSDLYFSNDEFKLMKGVKFSSTKETKQSDERFFLIGYQKVDSNYSKHNIKFLKEEDYFNVEGSFQENDKVFVVLDKFMDKRIYSMKDGSLIIQNVGLHGKYSIYVKINDVIYKTNQYVTF